MPEIPVPIVKSSMMEAIEELKKELQDFITVFENNEIKTMMNPFFGELNFEEWTHLLNKHFEHHCRQFSLL
jgi:hydroxymethylglutaryl-CoA reductase